jgi:hypothetical protein
LKLNSLFTKVLPFFFTPTYLSSSTNLANAKNYNSTLVAKPFLSSTGITDSTKHSKNTNDMLLAAFFLQKTLSLLPKLDYNLSTHHLFRPTNNILKLSGIGGGNIHILIYENSNKTLTPRNTKTITSACGLENKLSQFYSTDNFSKVITVSLNYNMLFNLNFSDFKTVSDNIKKNLLLGKQARWL